MDPPHGFAGAPETLPQAAGGARRVSSKALAEQARAALYTTRCRRSAHLGMKLATLSVMKEYAVGIQSSELGLVEAAPAKTREPGAASAPALSVVPANHGTPRPLSGSVDARIEIAPYNPAAPSSNPPPPPSAKVAAPSNIPAVDKFLAAATKEFEANIVDQPLWKHAITQSGNDRTVAIRTYLRAREIGRASCRER